ncbi:hypothetical protein RND81_07G059200 [Saponaria officinalis]|uniref:Uncharacterized protein n=1 Tax=Saponaria officinalis TaxID=3572 RepID=A0AAW1JMJ7_SAPOF
MVINKIDSICKAYLWEGHEFLSGSANVAWEKVCQPKEAGGLGVLNLRKWNIASVGKMPHSNTSSSWMSICRIRNALQNGFQGECIWDWWLGMQPDLFEHNEVLGALISTLLYHVWWSRNKSMVEACVTRPELVVETVMKEVKFRVNTYLRDRVKLASRVWIYNLYVDGWM